MKKIFTAILFFSAACKESYVPPVKSTNQSYLVVEGFINNGPDSTFISLSHTFKLDDSASVTPELHAHLTVEGKSDNSATPLNEWGGGQYGIAGLALNNGQLYRLHIITAAGKEYVSDFVDLKVSPTIDSISWARTADGLQIYANTHDPQNASHYYRWDYQQTWEFNSAFYASVKYGGPGNQVVAYYPDTFYTCWKQSASSNILLSSSLKLARDEISLYPLVLIPPDSWEISVRYSILVKQYVLTADAYNFWLNLQKNSEQIGSIFSPQPSESKGNVHALADSSELVIGFVSAGTVQQQRIFITPAQIPGWRVSSYNPGCAEVSIPEDSVDFFLASRQYLPIDNASDPTGGIRYNIADATCVDCTLTGTNVKPPFWP